jgi:glycosyltransferase involved in cell wall biosynthesis
MKIIYEVSSLGIGHIDNRGRAGIFRMIESLMNELLEITSIDISFISCYNFFDSILTEKYFQEEKPELFNRIINAWESHFISNHKYLSLLSTIHSDDSRNLQNRIKRKTLATILNLINKSAKKKKVNDFFDVYHSLFYPLTNNQEKIKSRYRAITIYDMIPYRLPHLFTKENCINFNKIINSINIENENDYVFCISQSTKNDFCEAIKIPEERVFVTHLGVSDKFIEQTDKEKIQQVNSKYKIPNCPYILALSTLEPRKNNAHLIKCFFDLLEQEKLNDVYLVLVGQKGWLYEEIFQTVQKNVQLKDRVIFTGYVPDEDLSYIYSGASFFVYPSLYEGFGLPPLEAMQCGVPVITSNISSLPEVVGDAGILVNPINEDELCQAMLNLLSDSNLRDTLKHKGIERAKQFSWSKCAAETVEIYKKIAR